jgi:ATP-binding cassette subfamily B protein
MLSHQTNPLKNFFKVLFSFKKELVFITIGIVLVSISIVLIGYSLRHFVDSGLLNNEKSTVILENKIIALLFLVFLLSFGSFIRSFFVNSLAQKLVSKLRLLAFKKVILTQNTNQNFHYEIEHNLGVIENLTATSLIFAIRNTILLTTSFILIYIENPHFLLKLISIIPLIFIPLVLFGRRLKAKAGKEKEIKKNLSQFLFENFSALKSLQIFGAEELVIKKLEDKEQTLRSISFTKTLLRSSLVSLVIFVVISYMVYLLWRVGLEIINNNISLGELTYLVFFSVLLASSFVSLADSYSNFANLKTALKKVFEIINLKIANQKGLVEIKKFKKLELKNVSDNLGILKSINLTINSGDFVAFVGQTGAGKSSLFNLILGFLQAKEGEILINNENISNVSNYLEKIALVPQNEIIFSENLKENICLGREGEVDELIKSLDLWHLKNFAELPKDLSGGEKQRILIARAIFKKAEIILLDEPTASLDLITEERVKELLFSLKEKATILVIAHRISTVLKADKIVIMDKGEIIDIGTHKELLTKNAFYKSLIALHFIDG